jgi:hypothetical protein
MTPSHSSNIIPLDRLALRSEEKTTDRHLTALAEQVRSHSRSSTKSIIAIGEALRDAKLHLGHGKFGEWVVAQCGLTMRTAQNYVRAAELTDKSEIVSLLNPAAIYRLAKPTTPPDVVARVLVMLQTGIVPTEPEIIGLILAASQTDKEATGAPKASDDGNALRLARELHARLGHDLISELIKARGLNYASISAKQLSARLLTCRTLKPLRLSVRRTASRVTFCFTNLSRPHVDFFKIYPVRRRAVSVLRRRRIRISLVSVCS